MLRNAEVIDEEEISTGRVNIGNKVKLYDEEFEEEIEYTIVGSAEADPSLGKISNESPLGMALLGHAIGDNVDVDAPDGILKFKVLDIQ